MTSIDEIEHAMKIAAKVVALYGDTYLPTFQRLHREFQKAQEQANDKAIALQLALQYSKKE